MDQSGSGGKSSYLFLQPSDFNRFPFIRTCCCFFSCFLIWSVILRHVHEPHSYTAVLVSGLLAPSWALIDGAGHLWKELADDLFYRSFTRQTFQSSTQHFAIRLISSTSYIWLCFSLEQLQPDVINTIWCHEYKCVWSLAVLCLPLSHGKLLWRTRMWLSPYEAWMSSLLQVW